MRRAGLPLLFCLVAAPLSPLATPRVAGAADEARPAVVSIGIVPYFTPEKIAQLYQPFIDYLNGNTPYRWELKLGRNHAELVSSVCSGEVSVAYLGPIPFAKALRACDARPVLLSLGADGKPFYHAVVVTADQKVATLGDLRGKKFGIFEMSTASHYLPLKMLAGAGLALGDVEPVYFGSQDKLVAGLLAGEAVAGGVKESLYEKFRGAGLRALATSEPLPGFVYAAGPKLPDAVARDLATALLKVRPHERPEDRERVKGWDPELANGFAAPPDTFKGSILALFASIEPYLK